MARVGKFGERVWHFGERRPKFTGRAAVCQSMNDIEFSERAELDPRPVEFPASRPGLRTSLRESSGARSKQFEPRIELFLCRFESWRWRPVVLSSRLKELDSFPEELETFLELSNSRLKSPTRA